MSVIPDPIDPMAGALDETGTLLAAVFMAPLDTPLNATWGQEDQS